MRMFFSAAAQLELEDAFSWLEREQPGLGVRFAADVDGTLARIQDQPMAWHPLGRFLRRCHLKHFRYGVIYRSRGETIEVLAIAHDSRSPGYWRDRLKA